MTLNWATQVAIEPKLLQFRSRCTAVTHGLMSEGSVRLSILKRDDRPS